MLRLRCFSKMASSSTSSGVTNWSQGAILILDKPKGANSRAACAQALDQYKEWTGMATQSKDSRSAQGSDKRRKPSQNHIKMGHAGTLDPMATGCLPVLLGQATRLQDLIPIDEKRYLAHVRLGIKTDSDDADGAIVRTDETFKGLSADRDLEPIFSKFRGRIIQTPPIYSAIHIDGKRAYDLARAGETVTIPPREVMIHALTGKRIDDFTVLLDVSCGTGTYIRTLGADIAHALGTEGHLVSLRRVSSGIFNVPEERRSMDSGVPEICRVVSFEEAIRAIAPIVDLTEVAKAKEHLAAGRQGPLFKELNGLIEGKGDQLTMKVALAWNNSVRALVNVDFVREAVTSLCHFKDDELIPFVPDLVKRKFSAIQQNPEELRIVQFNILADGLSGKRPDLGGFDGIPFAVLNWDFRMERIVKEILTVSPHVIALEELDHYEQIKARLGAHYEGVFIPKRNSPCLAHSDSPDGSAIFYDTRRLKLVEDLSFQLGESDSQVCAAVVLEDVVSSTSLLVCAAHLKAMKDGDGVGEAIRVRQASTLISKATEMKLHFNAKDVVLCCDLNGVPTGDAYKSIVTSGEYISAMKHLMSGDEPPMTTIKQRGNRGIAHTIDYIFLSAAGNLRPNRYLIVPSSEIGYLPSWLYPSDHLMLCVALSPS